MHRDNIAVKDKFSDFRVVKLRQALTKFDSLLGHGIPVHEILGTQLYFLSNYMAHTAATSKLSSFSRRDRVWWLRWSLAVVDSFNVWQVTKQNFVATFLSLEFSLTDEGLVNPGRDSTAMLEYYIGGLRTHRNALTIVGGQYVAQRVAEFEKVCRANGYKTGDEARRYSSAWEALETTNHAPLKEYPGIAQEEHLGVINNVGAAVRPLLETGLEPMQALRVREGSGVHA